MAEDVADAARALFRRGRSVDARRLLEGALAKSGPSERLYRELIYLLEETNSTKEAVAAATRAKAAFPRPNSFELLEQILSPVVYADQREIERYRRRRLRYLEQLGEVFPHEDPGDIERAVTAVTSQVNFYPGYQGRNELRPQSQWGDLLHLIASARYPQWSTNPDTPSPASGERIRIGYIASEFRDHSITKLFLGWMRECDHQQFELFAYHDGKVEDRLTAEVRRACDHFRQIPGDVEAMGRAIASDRLDVLVYLDVRHKRLGLMSTLRLAPVQCAAWAFPITSGSPCIDYFLSSDAMEPPSGAKHYRERLVRLPGIGVCYPKPLVPRPILSKTKTDFGAQPDGVLYVCCQAIFKYLPQYDHLLADIASQVGNAEFAFILPNAELQKQFCKRMDVAFARNGLRSQDHCIYLPPLRKLDYFNLNLVGDVFLDTCGWSGGVTTLEAIACGLPVVTMPGALMRSRHSYGILSQLGLTETVAHSRAGYVDIAARLGMDASWGAKLRGRMRENEGRLFNRTEPVRALEDFYRRAVRERRGLPGDNRGTILETARSVGL